MRIIERALVGKHSQDDCEDGIVVTDDFVAVIDGSTSKTKHRVNPEMKNGRYCMTIISNYIKAMSADVSLDDFCEGITEKVHSLYPSGGSLQSEHPEERLCASAIIYSNYRREIWMIGDCQCMINGELYTNGKPSEKIISGKRAAIFGSQHDLHSDMTDGKGHIIHDYARDVIIPDLIKTMQGENKTYAVIDGFPIYRKGVKVLKLPADSKSAIVLASDGYPFLCSTLEKSERKLKKQLDNDPYNIDTFLATKGLMQGNVSFDDRAYIRFSNARSQRYFINISFDGTAYHGWQIQPNGKSVQETLQDCLSKVLREKIEVTGAGRTDAGVHARTMVCHVDYDEGIDCGQLVYRLNQILPQDICCNKVNPVSNDLHARFSAKKRTYRYFIHTDKNPFKRHFSVETHYPLDFKLMNEAAEYLLTVRDFKAFCKAGADNKTTFCKVTTAHWQQTGEYSWYFEISADRFLRNMVRAVVGTLFDVGRKKITLQQFRQIVDYGSRSDSGESMPAKGLFLWDIEY